MQTKINIKNKNKQDQIKVRVVRSPLVDTRQLRQIVLARSTALVL